MTRFLKSSSLVLLLISYGGLKAQSFDFAQNQIAVWEMAKSRTIRVAQSMPEDLYSYKPVPEVMSFGQQMVHISNSMLSMNSRFILKKSYNGIEKNAANLSKSEIIEELTTAFDEVISLMRKLTDQQLMTEGKPHGEFPLTKWQSLLFMRDHITNHRAKAVLYLRLNGIKPPDYGFN
ncbi:DinB family protein [Roseivirga sp.]|uniref:DinB family protein n=1 Tax=Roseivirga sp. TaxID=1964215 RepID=UPI003B51D248